MKGKLGTTKCHHFRMRIVFCEKCNEWSQCQGDLSVEVFVTFGPQGYSWLFESLKYKG